MATRKAADKFPLWLHPSGQWCKKHKGEFHYFGTDQQAALKRYANEWDDIRAGRKPRPQKQGEAPPTLADVVNSFLAAKRLLVDSDELTPAMWGQYYAVCHKLMNHFGRNRTVSDLRPEDFAELRAKVAASVGPVTLIGFITKARVAFKFAYDRGAIETPVRYGNGFDRPSKKTLRQNRARKPAKLITSSQAWELIGSADPQLRAMIYLGLNGGMGATDCSQLTRSMLTRRRGWLDFPRPKTGTLRRFPLWVETQAALAVVHKCRPVAKDPAHADRVFLTRTGQPWVRFAGDEHGKRSVMDSVALQFAKLATTTGVAASFGTLRHTFRTVADELPDRPAVDMIMGHTDQSMAGYYREQIADKRLQAVTSHVRTWLLAGKARNRRSRK